MTESAPTGPSAAEVLEKVFTSANPATGSQPPPAMAWVVFAHGTAFFTTPTIGLPPDASFDAIADAARAALTELGPVLVGSPAADFHTARLDGWYPDDPVWFVSYDHPAIATIILHGGAELAAGILARGHRQQDHDEQQIVLVRRFDGSTRAR